MGGVWYSAIVQRAGSDTIYDAYNEYSMSSGGVASLTTSSAYVSITFISDGDGFWWTETGHGGSWSSV
jgi:hypothetical protein